MNLSQDTGLPPAAELLKYVAFKNHGLLLLSDLNHEKDTIDKEEFDERIDIIVDEFSEALLYDSDEDLFLELLYSISMSLGYFRIARLCLECIIESPSRSYSLYQDFESGKFLPPSDYRVLKSYFLLCEKLQDKLTLDEQRSTADMAIQMEFLDQKFKEEDDVTWLSRSSLSELEPHKLTYDGSITISSSDWLSLLSSMQDFVVNLAAKTKRKFSIEDSYNNSLKPATSVTLSLPAAEVVKEVTPATPMEIVSTEETEDAPKEKEDSEKPSETVENGTDTAVAESVPKKKRRKSFDEAMKSRSSKRVRARTDDKQGLEDVDLTEDESFFAQITSFLSLCGEKFETIVPIFLNEETTTSELFISDFKSCILNWEEEQAETLAKMRTDKKSSKVTSKKPLLFQIIDTFASPDKIDSANTTSLSSSQLAANFIESAHNKKYHIQELRIELIRSILLPQSQGLSAILSDTWPLNAVDMLKKMIDQCEVQLGELSRQVIFSSSTETIYNEIFMVQTIMEMVADTYLHAMKILRTPEHHSKQVLKDLELVRSNSPTRYMFWQRTYGDLVHVYPGPSSDLNSLMLRNEWTNVLVQQVECEESWENLDDFLAVESDVQAIDESISFAYLNFPSLPDLSMLCIKSQVSRLKAMSTLSRVFVEDDSDEKKPEDVNMAVVKSRISLLECVLMPEYQETISPEYEAISDYFINAPLKLRSQFWSILLADYNNTGEKQKSLDGYLKVFSDTVQTFTDSEYDASSDQQRGVILIRSIFICHDIISKIVLLLQSNDSLLDNVQPSKVKVYLDAVIKLLRMLHVFILFDDAIISNALQAPSHSSWEKASTLFKEIIVYGWSLLYFLFKTNTPEDQLSSEILNDMLSIIHEQLGTRGYCSLAQGVLLDISLKEMMRLKFSESDADLLQCLHCRYGIVMGHEDFHPYDHHTTPEDIDKDSALLLVDFVMSLVLRKKNMAQSILRSDVKGVLDQLYDAIGFPDQSVSAIEKNNATLNNMLNSTISILFLQDCFYGRQSLELATPPPHLYRLASSGFYYILGQTRMSLFKIRKRSLPGRTEDISEAIKFFKYDLMCGCSDRFETWFALSQGYDALVEDDLTWNTYKINSASAREAVGIRQRKAIISCAIAVNCYLKNGPSDLFANTPAYQQLIGSAWSFFARLLFNSIQAPLEMEAYVSDKDKLLCGPDGLYYRPPTYKIKPTVILKACLLCLQLSIKEMPNDWFNFYLKGKCLHQMKADPIEVLDSFVTSISLCPEKPGSHGELILEPHYKLVSRVYKYLRAGSITSEVALSYLEKSQYRDEKAVVSPSDKPENDKIYGICISTLAKIRAGDKKKWHHRPTFRIAKIYDDCGDILKAKEEMITFFQIKSTSKTPIHIWKTEFERPGQHFQYVNQYVKYFITLLERTNDVTLFGILSKSLRKFVSGMIDHQAVWELLCTTVARMLKDQLNVPAKFNDNVIPQLVFADFDRDSQKISQHVETEEELHPMLKYLNYAAELRRLNNGFGSTAALDDLFVAIYLIIYQDFVTNIFPAESSNKEKTPPPPEEKPVVIHAPNPVSSTKISVMDLLSQPATIPESKPSSPSTPVSEGKTQPGTPSAGKIRVTRRDIISRSLALLRVALPKLIKGDNLKISTSPTGSNKPSPGLSEAAATPTAESLKDGKALNFEKSSPAVLKENGNTSVKLEEGGTLSETGTPKKANGNGIESMDIDEVETLPSTPLIVVQPDGDQNMGDADDVIIIESSPIKMNRDEDMTDSVVETPDSAAASRPRSRNSDWLSTIL